MGIWQIVWIALMAMSLGCTLADHGKLRVKKDNFWIGLASTLLMNAILYLGGFFG